MLRTVIDFDHHSREYALRRDEILRDLRERAPVAWTESHGGHWVVTSYDLVREVVADDETFTVEFIPGGRGGLTIPEIDRPRIIPGETDGEEHQRYRRTIIDRFTRPVIQAQRDWIRSLIDDRVKGLAGCDEFDIVADLAVPVPVQVVLDYLRLDVGDPAAYFRAVEHAIGIHLEDDDPQAGLESDDARAEIKGVWQKLLEAVEEKRGHPDDGLITHLTQKDPPLTDLEVRDLIVSVVLGGARTTASLIENMLWHLDDDQALRATLGTDFSLLPKAIEEFMRLYSPSPVIARTATADCQLGGVEIRAGDRLLCSWHSANHDEAQFEAPESFDMDRTSHGHVGFGVGAHFCLGVWLARAEAEMVLQSVLTEMPEFVIDRSRSRQYEDIGVLNQWVTMPATPRP